MSIEIYQDVEEKEGVGDGASLVLMWCSYPEPTRPGTVTRDCQSQPVIVPEVT